MLRILLSLVGFIAIALAWIWLVGAIGIMWVVRHPQVPAGSDTYFIVGSRLFRWVVILPLLLFSLWYWRRMVTRAA
jgi:hypothetical protein